MQYILTGKVIRGDGYGKKIGYPTINLDRRHFLKLKNKPTFGVYAGWVNLKNKKYKSGIIIGPLDAKGLPKIEAHLIGFNGDAYGNFVTIEICRFIRKFKVFNNEVDLIRAIKKDIDVCSQE